MVADGMMVNDLLVMFEIASSFVYNGVLQLLNHVEKTQSTTKQS